MLFILTLKLLVLEKQRNIKESAKNKKAKRRKNLSVKT